jgi:KUP system potassium uptake protein
MMTWRRGREILFQRLGAGSLALEPFLKSLFRDPPERVHGTAVFLTATPESTPHALLHSLKHYKVLHERIVFLTVKFRDVPWVAFDERVRVHALGHNCWRVEVRYGFMNRPDVMRALELCAPLGLEFDPMDTSFFLSREKIVPVQAAGGMALWRERLFAAMARNAGNVTDYFNIPPNRVVELGTRVEF